MKKTVLASSIAAAVFGLGVAGAANAQSFSVNAKGIGQMLVVPYYTVQDNNNTLINLVNTDTTNGKAVKIRFRSAANSDDVFDFQLFMSPGDVWAANVSKGADGLPVLNVGDTSCTKPATIAGVPFVTSRLNSSWTTAEKANNAREGYIEIINMADVPPQWTTGDSTANPVVSVNAANPLFTAIKHTSTGGAPACRTAASTTTAWTQLDDLQILTADSVLTGGRIDRRIGISGLSAATTLATGNEIQKAKLAGLSNASGGLMANWTIINTVGAAAWTGEAVAIRENTGSGLSLFVNYFSQTNTLVTNASGTSIGTSAVDGLQFAASVVFEDKLTADPLFRRTQVYRFNQTNQTIEHDRTGTNDFLVAPAEPIRRFDIPDLSTPVGALDARVQASALSQVLATSNFINEYITETGIGAKTDWVFSMPTRRYNIAMNYSAVSTNDKGRRWTNLGPVVAYASPVGNPLAADLALSFPYFTASNTTVNADGQICVSGVTRSAYDREERIETAAIETVISPGAGSAPQLFCGEVSVLSINNDSGATSGALKASVAVKDLATSYSNGWMSLGLGEGGLPVVGFAAVKANGAANGQTYGATWNHRTK